MPLRNIEHVERGVDNNEANGKHLFKKGMAESGSLLCYNPHSFIQIAPWFSGEGANQIDSSCGPKQFENHQSTQPGHPAKQLNLAQH